MSPRKAFDAKPPKPWQREAAGSYRSADGRFLLEGDGAGRWFVRDEQETDELGLPRTSGPFATLAGAKEAAAERRERPREASPLAARLKATTERAKGAPDGKPFVAPAQATRPPSPPPPTWLDRLESKDRGVANRARRLIQDLESIGIADAAGLVRRDIEGGQPEVARRLLGEALRRAAEARLETGNLAVDARGAGVPVPDGSDAYAAWLVARALGVAVQVIADEDRLASAPSAVPGWELVERGPERRRIRLTVDDLGR